MDKYFSAYEVYQQGKSLNEVAEILQVTRQCVYKAFVARKLKMRSASPQEVQVFDGKKLTQEEAVNLVIRELNKANEKFPLFNSAHEGYAVLLEEVDEMWDEVKKNRKLETRLECIQVAAMAIKFLMS